MCHLVLSRCYLTINVLVHVTLMIHHKYAIEIQEVNAETISLVFVPWLSSSTTTTSIDMHFFSVLCSLFIFKKSICLKLLTTEIPGWSRIFWTNRYWIAIWEDYYSLYPDKFLCHQTISYMRDFLYNTRLI